MSPTKRTTKFAPENKALMIWDGDCGFCHYWVLRWKKITNDAIDYAPFQEVAPAFKDIDESVFRESVVLVEPDGTYYINAAAPFRSFTYGKKWGWLYSLYESSGAFAALSDRIYRLISNNRPSLMKVTIATFGKNPASPKPYWLLYLLGINMLVLMLWLFGRRRS
ncbi:MAG: DCC1-like thiol-disulfide oxidoreductase family protein [Bacteroidia bacterium]